MAIRVNFVVCVLAALLFAASVAKAETVGSNLTTAPDDSVCKFQVSEPATRVCTVDQHELVGGHAAANGLKVPFDGVVVRWSVVSGPVLPGTGKVTMALRATQGPGYMEKGPEVELPLGAPGTRYSYAERLPVTAGQPVGLRITIENRSVQEAGAPIAFTEPGVGTIDRWSGDPESASWDVESGVELLLDAEIEPDADHDGYGDRTQDCFPNHPGDQALCGRDLTPPVIKPQFAKVQGFLRTGRIVVRVSSNETGVAKASGDLRVKGKGVVGRGYVLHGARKAVAAGGVAVLRLQVWRKALKAVRLAAAEGKKITVTGRVGVLDASGNESQAPIRVQPISPKAPKN